MVDKGLIDVESWVNLEVWVGKHRVMGNAVGPGASTPPRSDESLVWVVQERQHNLSVWLDARGLADGFGLVAADVLQKWRAR